MNLKRIFTTFWLDWAMLPIMLGIGWATYGWSRSDVLTAQNVISGTEGYPSWLAGLPLLLSSVSFVVMGFGMLLRNELWEHRLLNIGQVLLIIGSIVGLLFILYGSVVKAFPFQLPEQLTVLGLLVLSCVLVWPAFLDPNQKEKITAHGRIWLIVFVIGVALLAAGTIHGFPFLFPRFGLGVGSIYLIGLGMTEIMFKKPAFAWMVTLWRVDLGREYVLNYPASSYSQAEGWVKTIVGLGAGAILVLVALGVIG